MAGKKILIVCSDPGASQAVLSFYGGLKKRGRRVAVVANRSGRMIAERLGIVRESSKSAYGTEGSIKRYLLSRRPDFVITGTSMRDDLERKYIRLSRALGIPVLSLVDWWTNLEKRFIHAKDKRFCIPDFVWVIDRAMKRNCPDTIKRKAKIIVGGNPYFLKIKEGIKKGARRASRADMLKNLKLDLSRKTIVFFAEPLFKGFDQFMIFDGLACAISGAVDEKGINLIIKFHPRGQKKEIYNKYRSIAGNRLDPAACRCRFIADRYTASELIDCADYVWGINTAPMLEAMLKGKPVSSFLPDFDAPGVPFLKSGNICASCDEFGKFEALVKNLLTDKGFVDRAKRSQQRYRMKSGDFAGRIVSVMEEG